MVQLANEIETNAERNPVVQIRDGEAFANSRDVAAFFGKRHADVMRTIENLVEQDPDLGVRNFAQGSYCLPETGSQEHRCYDMDRDGFTYLAMGFTGARALQYKKRYVAAFNAMEAELRRQAGERPAIDLNDPAALRGLLLSYSEKAETLQRQVEELIPSRDALDRIAEADGSLCITDAAKALQMRPKDLFAWLQANRWIYRRPGGSGFLGYSSKTQQGLLEHKVTTITRADGSERVTEQVRVTPKGLTLLAKIVNPAARLV